MCTYKHTCTHTQIFLFCFLLSHISQIFMTKIFHFFCFFKNFSKLTWRIYPISVSMDNRGLSSEVNSEGIASLQKNLLVSHTSIQKVKAYKFFIQKSQHMNNVQYRLGTGKLMRYELRLKVYKQDFTKEKIISKKKNNKLSEEEAQRQSESLPALSLAGLKSIIYKELQKHRHKLNTPFESLYLKYIYK